MASYRCIFELPQESVDVIDPHQRADIADAQLGVRQKLHRFLNPEELDAVAQVRSGLAFIIGRQIAFGKMERFCKLIHGKFTLIVFSKNA